MAANRLKPQEYVILFNRYSCAQKTWRLRQTRELKGEGRGSRMVRSKTASYNPPPQDAFVSGIEVIG